MPDPLCVGLPSTRDDARLITHADAAAMAAQVPDMNYPAPGAGGLPLPRTIVEALSMLAYSRSFAILQPHPTHTKHPGHTSHPPLARLQATRGHFVLVAHTLDRGRRRAHALADR